MKLKELRKQRGLTQRKLSELTNIPLRTIEDLEADKKMHIKSTKAENLYKICLVLGVPMEIFFE